MSDELEQAVLGALAIKPSLMEGCLVRAYDFPPGRPRETFNALSEIWESERPNEIDPLLLAERARRQRSEPSILRSSSTGSIKLDPDVFCRRVTELRKRFLTSRIESVIVQQAKTGQLDLEDIRADLKEYQGLEDEKAFDTARVLMTGNEMQAMDLKIEYAVDNSPRAEASRLYTGQAVWRRPGSPYA